MEEEQVDQHQTNDDFTLWTITGDNKEGYHVKLQINGKHTQMELDTEAAVCDIRAAVESVVSKYTVR